MLTTELEQAIAAAVKAAELYRGRRARAMAAYDLEVQVVAGTPQGVPYSYLPPAEALGPRWRNWVALQRAARAVVAVEAACPAASGFTVPANVHHLTDVWGRDSVATLTVAGSRWTLQGWTGSGRLTTVMGGGTPEAVQALQALYTRCQARCGEEDSSLSNLYSSWGEEDRFPTGLTFETATIEGPVGGGTFFREFLSH